MRTLLGVVTALVLVATGGGSAAAAGELPVPYSYLAAHAQNVADPGGDPAGANDWSCTPSAAHPRPVVLLHGWLANQKLGNATLSPYLANEGFCVYSFTYGAHEQAPSVGAVRDMAQSAAELSAFVDRVLAASGADEVDIVGDSQGAVVSAYYLKFLGGAAQVGSQVGITPLYGGTTQLGLNVLFNLVLDAPGIGDAVREVCMSCDQLLVPSAWIDRLGAGGATVPGVAYTNIVTRYDEMATPYTTGMLNEPGVRNLTVQDGCGIDFSDHFAAPYTRRVAAMTFNALDPAHAKPVPCHLVLPVIG